MHVWFKGAIPWAWVPGPHDWEAEVNGLIMMHLVSQEEYDMAKYNRFKWEGRELKHPFTYELNIEKFNDSTTVMARLYFFGTGRYDCLGMGGNDCIRYD